MGPPPSKVTIEIEDEKSDNMPSKIPLWQKIKQLTLTITAITTLISTIGGLGILILNKNSAQDKIQESTYGILSNRIEKLTVQVAVLQENVRHLEKENNKLVDEIQIYHKENYLTLHSDIRKEMPEYSTIIETINEQPGSPEYKESIKLPDFKDIQEKINDTNMVIKE